MWGWPCLSAEEFPKELDTDISVADSGEVGARRQPYTLIWFHSFTALSRSAMAQLLVPLG